MRTSVPAMGEKSWSPIDPVAVLLVSKGSRGDKLLYRYPFDDAAVDECLASTVGRCIPDDALQPNSATGGVTNSSFSSAGVPSQSTHPSRKTLTTNNNNLNSPNPHHPRYHQATPAPAYNRNPYTLPTSEDAQPLTTTRSAKVANTCLGPDGMLVGVSDRILGNLLAVKQELCGGKFELKVNDVVFVGHPKLLVDHGAAGSGGGGASVVAQSSADSTTCTEQQTSKKSTKEISTLTLFNVVFVSNSLPPLITFFVPCCSYLWYRYLF